jgi:hypothetical protein
MAFADKNEMRSTFAASSWLSATSTLAPIFEFFVLLAVASLMHVIVLTLVFPGYYDPLWPDHSDYYVAADFAHNPMSLLAYFTWPRPIGYLYMKLTGLLGTRLSIACTLAIIVSNCALTTMALRRMVGLRFTPSLVVASAIYAFLVFAQPLQYVWSSFDVFAQLSYCFLVSALLLSLWNAPFPAIFMFCVFAMLAKETYAIALPALAVLWYFLAGPAERRAPLRFGLANGLALVATVAYNLSIKSPFVGVAPNAISDYKPDYSPVSILQEWLSYASDMGVAMWLCLVAIAAAAAFLVQSLPLRARGIGLSFALGGALAWLPNAMLPHHHFKGYEFNGAYLLCAPALLLAPLWDERKRVWLAALFIGALLSPVAGQHAYSQGWWSVEQQARQRNLMIAVQQGLKTLSPEVKSVLVTGLEFPFSPFDHPYSLYEYAKHLPQFRVVYYDASAHKRPSSGLPVTWVSPDDAFATPHDEIWTFGVDGKIVDLGDSVKNSKALEALGGDIDTLKLYPEAAIALRPLDDSSPVADAVAGNAYLSCGQALLRYHRPALAHRCFAASETRMPSNPYPYFYSASAYEAEGDFLHAEAELTRAVALDNVNAPNKYFNLALARVRAARLAQSPNAD